GYGAVADNPLARLVDVGACGEIHDRVGAPADRPDHFLDFFFDRTGDGGIANVGVDLHQEVAADDHRLDFGVVDVGRDDGAAPGNFFADKFGRDGLRQPGAPIFAGMLTAQLVVDLFET